MVAGPCKKARAAQDCQEEKNSRCQTDRTKRAKQYLRIKGCLQSRNSFVDFRGKKHSDGNPSHFHRFFHGNRPFHGNGTFVGITKISWKMYLMYNEGCSEDGCPTRDSLPWPAPARQLSRSMRGLVCRSVTCYSAVVFCWLFLNTKQIMSWKRWAF